MMFTKREAVLEEVYNKLRGTNADLCKTPGAAYRLMLETVRALLEATRPETDEVVAKIRAHVENYDTPAADDPRRRYTVAQLETAIRRATLLRIRGEGE